MTIWTESDMTALKTAIASGVQTVTYTGPPSRTITYQSLAEMRKLLADMQADVETTAGTRKPYRFAQSSKGFE